MPSEMLHNPETLIQSLAADLKPVRVWKIRTLRAVFLSLFGVIVLTGGFALGLRPDWQQALMTPIFLFSVFTLLLTTVFSTSNALRLSLPGEEPALWSLQLNFALPLFLVTILLLLWSIYSSFTPVPRTFPTGAACMITAFAIGFLPWLSFSLILRKRAPFAAKSTAYLTALAGFCTGALAVQLHCNNEAPGHLTLWHGLPILIISAILSWPMGWFLNRWKNPEQKR